MKPKIDLEWIPDLRDLWRNHPLSARLFLALCLNAILAPAVYAAANSNEVTRFNSYAIGLLGLVTIGLAIYLLAVMFQPQRF